MKTFGKWILLSLFIVTTSPALAGLEKDLERFFSEVGATNVTHPGAYKGQEGGFYTGGSLYMRNPSRNIQLINVQIPKIEAGCSGINLFTGGMGYINSQKFIETLKAIGANAVGYGFSLGLKQMSPQIMNQIEELQALMNEMNLNNINSCQMASKLVNNGASYLHEETVRTCIQEELTGNTDYFTARRKCQTQDVVNDKNKSASAKGATTMDNINVVWRAIQKNDALRVLDKDLKFLLMSLTGTVVIKTDGVNAPQVKTYLSKLESSNIIHELVTGQNLSVYACQDELCLNIVERVITLPPNKTFVGQIRHILEELEIKVIKDEEELTKSEKAFLENTSLPVYRMLNVYAAYGKGTSLLFPSYYSEVIATDVLFHYIENGINDVTKALNEPEFPKKLDDKVTKMIEIARTRARDLKLMQMKKTGTIDDMIAKVQMMEKQVNALVSSQIFNHIGAN